MASGQSLAPLGAAIPVSKNLKTVQRKEGMAAAENTRTTDKSRTPLSSRKEEKKQITYERKSDLFPKPTAKPTTSEESYDSDDISDESDGVFTEDRSRRESSFL